MSSYQHQAVESLNKKKEEVDKARDELFLKVLSSAEGKIFLGLLMEQSGFFTNSHLNSATDPGSPIPNSLQMSFLEGKRFIGEQIFSWIRHIEVPSTTPLECVGRYNAWLKAVWVKAEMGQTPPEQSEV